MNKVELLKKHFPFTEITIGELYDLKEDRFPQTSFFMYKNERFDYFYLEGKKSITSQFALYKSDSEYAFTRIGRYEIVSVYNVSSFDNIRAFLLEYVSQQSEEDLMWALKDAVEYF